jgi:hypothetical protein
MLFVSPQMDQEFLFPAKNPAGISIMSKNGFAKYAHQKQGGINE